ncbi:MAG: M23 family metallopeptidase [Xanthomonadales bacterium]|nr:M23 family metallopeptidase [Xanthomonadales bacterium]
MTRCLSILFALTALLVGAPARADQPHPCGVTLPTEAWPGAMVKGRIAPGGLVTVLGRNLRVGPAGDFVFGLPSTAKGQIAVHLNDGRGCKGIARITAKPREYLVERVSGLPPQTVNPDPATEARIARENEAIRAARDVDTPGLNWNTDWKHPAIGRISGVYGSQRILNGQPRNPHMGLDIAAPTGTVVKAPAPGVVSLVGRDYVLTGNTVLIDHGMGISSLYIHLHSISVRQGQRIATGETIGGIGMTGAAPAARTCTGACTGTRNASTPRW